MEDLFMSKEKDDKVYNLFQKYKDKIFIDIQEEEEMVEHDDKNEDVGYNSDLGLPIYVEEIDNNLHVTINHDDFYEAIDDLKLTSQEVVKMVLKMVRDNYISEDTHINKIIIRLTNREITEDGEDE